MKPRTLWACQPVAAMMRLSVAPPGRVSSSSTWAVVLPPRALVGFSGLSAFFWPLGTLGLFLAEVAFFTNFPLAGATRGFCAPTLAFFGGLGSWTVVVTAGVAISSMVDVVISFNLLT